MLVLYLSNFDVLLFAIDPAKTGLCDFAEMFSWLPAYNTQAIPASNTVDYGKILHHVATNEI